MCKPTQDRSRKMGRGMGIGKSTSYARHDDRASWRQAFGFNAAHVQNKGDDSLGQGRGAKQAKEARFDQATGRCGRVCNQPPIPLLHKGLIVGHEVGPQSHELQGQGRLAAARWPGDQKTVAVEGDAACMQQKRRCFGQIGRPTTNRAPKGSEVGSALVGRMFSAQITPPWASTICLEIDRPSPELLPKWLAGRSE